MIKFLITLIGLLFVGSLGFAIFLGYQGGRDSVTYDEDVAIVLGARVFCGNDQKPRPSEALIRRLDKAVEFARRNQQAKLIVSGGQGKDECGTEAAAMQSYLVEQGIGEQTIIREEGATSTEENMRFSYDLMRQHDLEDAVIITSQSHMFRAVRTAERIGFTPHKLHSSEGLTAIPGSYLYEVLQNIRFLISPPAAAAWAVE